YTYTDGCVYACSRSSLSPGSHNYFFTASDGHADTSTSTSSGPTVTNSVPTLTSGSVTPSFGSSSTQFTFTVTYTDADDNAPSYVRVYIDGSSYTMWKQNGGDYTYTDGCVYAYTRTLSIGTHTYRFSTSDGANICTTPNVNGPAVSDMRLSLLSVSPESGDPDTSFRFQVRYTHGSNFSPSSILIYVDGTAHEMSKVNTGDTYYADGCDYEYTTKLSAGSHYYFIECYRPGESIMTGVEYLEVSSSAPVQPATIFTVVVFLIGSVATISTASIAYKVKVKKVLTTLVSSNPSSPGRASTGSGWGYSSDGGGGVIPLASHLLPPSAFVTGTESPPQPWAVGGAQRAAADRDASSAGASGVSGSPPVPEPILPGSPKWAHLARYDISMYCGGPDDEDGGLPGQVEGPGVTGTAGDPGAADGSAEAPGTGDVPTGDGPSDLAAAGVQSSEITGFGLVDGSRDALAHELGAAGASGEGWSQDLASPDVEAAGEDEGGVPDIYPGPDATEAGLTEALTGDGVLPAAPAIIVARPSRDGGPAPGVVDEATHIAICPLCRKQVPVDRPEGALSYLCRACMKPMNFEVACAACTSITEVSHDELQAALDGGLRCPVCFEPINL
ncbi:MAG: hypothetical protein JW839_16665, partial [Candidatus Lokiarchaeota archaeon]|nr:hypothetical protein [Candidatus Lokiarchaeota archaeon]